MIDHITFTGIDARTPLEKVRGIHEEYPNVEFGVLVGSRTGQLSRFPGVTRLSQWKEFFHKHSIPAAIHLCGVMSRSVLKRNWIIVSALVDGYDRVQLNLPVEMRRNYNHVIREFAQIVPKLIIQHNSNWESVPILHKRIEYLFDRSGGRGRFNLEQWPVPNPDGRCGYSGGLSPKNVHLALEFLHQFPDRHVWLDMESGVRTNDWLDLDKVRQVCSQVHEQGKLL